MTEVRTPALPQVSGESKGSVIPRWFEQTYEEWPMWEWEDNLWVGKLCEQPWSSQILRQRLYHQWDIQEQCYRCQYWPKLTVGQKIDPIETGIVAGFVRKIQDPWEHDQRSHWCTWKGHSRMERKCCPEHFQSQWEDWETAWEEQLKSLLEWKAR